MCQVDGRVTAGRSLDVFTPGRQPSIVHLAPVRSRDSKLRRGLRLGIRMHRDAVLRNVPSECTALQAPSGHPVQYIMHHASWSSGSTSTFNHSSKSPPRNRVHKSVLRKNSSSSRVIDSLGAPKQLRAALLEPRRPSSGDVFLPAGISSLKRGGGG